jgi:ubiquitin carboxyl-terminal hydrolase 25/28
MTTEPYILQSIMIHEGQAESGHYYSYTYDTDRKIWRKFNDINVSEEAE